jgi:hypothetical protein
MILIGLSSMGEIKIQIFAVPILVWCSYKATPRGIFCYISLRFNVIKPSFKILL